MYSINLKNPSIIISTELKNIKEILPHEKVIVNRKKTLIKYYRKEYSYHIYVDFYLNYG